MMTRTERDDMREKLCGHAAALVVQASGGSVTFDEYDELMKSQYYLAPMNWCQGWGDRTLLRSNQDKLCAFKAVQMGLIRQTETGYELVEE